MHPQTEPRQSPSFSDDQASTKHARLIVLSIFAIFCLLLLRKNLDAQKHLDGRVSATTTPAIKHPSPSCPPAASSWSSTRAKNPTTASGITSDAPTSSAAANRPLSGATVIHWTIRETGRTPRSPGKAT